MTHDDNFEEYLRKMLSNSISSLNPSEEAKAKARKLSPSYFKDLKEKLLIEYEGKGLADVMDCKVSKESYGEVLKIENSQKIDFNIEDNHFRNQINNNLKLLPKIGLKTEQNLKKKGYTTIESLKDHDKYSDVADKFLSTIDDMSYLEIMDLLDNNRYTKKCRNNIIKSISLKDPEDFKFMDIETKGLSNVPIILIGVAEIKPFIKNRCRYNRIDGNLDLPHLDLMYFAKNLWSDELPNCQLQTIERELFGIEREGDVPGQYIPGYYDTYLEKNNIGPVVPIIEHNCQDIISLASFLDKMYRDVN